MSGALMNKVWDLFGMDSAEPEEYEDENVYDYDEEQEEVEDKKIFGRKNKVVNMPQANAIQMVISQPTNFEQSDEICAFLKEKKSVIVNLEYVNKDVARRIVDFITFGVNANTKVVGAEKIKHIKSGAIITSNHFNPVDTTIIRLSLIHI